VKEDWLHKADAAFEYCMEQNADRWNRSEIAIDEDPDYPKLSLEWFGEEISDYEDLDESLEKCWVDGGYVPLQSTMDVVARALSWEKIEFEFTNPRTTESMMWDYPPNADYLFGDNLVIDNRGYGYIFDHKVKKLLEQHRVFLNQKVTEIDYSHESQVVVQAEFQPGQITKNRGPAMDVEVIAKFAVSTLPLGVLQKSLDGSAVEEGKAPRFVPSLPEKKRIAIEGMSMGLYSKVTLVFDCVWWDATKDVLASTSNPFKTWNWALNYELLVEGSKMIQFHITDEFARKVEKQSVNETKTDVMQYLRTVYGETSGWKGCGEPQIDHVDVTSWSEDPWTYGSYSSWPLGYTWNQWKHLLRAENRLWFAGEHTAENFGFVHSAWDTGSAVAGRILRQERKSQGSDLVQLIEEQERPSRAHPKSRMPASNRMMALHHAFRIGKR